MRATSVKPASTWQGAPVDSIVLDHDDRHRRRMAMTGTRGTSFLLDLPQATVLRNGDALVMEDGGLIEVVAAPEPLLEIRCDDPLLLARIVWHLGNRHLPTQLLPRKVRIRRDHVIADMVKGLGGRIIEIEAPFDPEGGAYAGEGHSHAHGHHDHGHSHDHGPHDHGHHDHDHGEHDHGDHGHHHHHGHHSHGHER